MKTESSIWLAVPGMLSRSLRNLFFSYFDILTFDVLLLSNRLVDNLEMLSDLIDAL